MLPNFLDSFNIPKIDTIRFKPHSPAKTEGIEIGSGTFLSSST